MPRTPQSFSYDLDGNLTNDGRFAITWDGENRATSFTSVTSAPAASRTKVDCTYDSQWRRTQKIVSTWSGTAYVPQSTNHFVYDNWNLLAVLDHTNGPLYSFTWGTDLSGTEQGAGGISGLISMRVHTGPLAGTYFYVFDGNGNVMMLINAADGSIAAQYEYSPFGEVIRATGPLAQVNPFRFSTKFQDDETGFVYYGYRYYDPNAGRWLSRDPMEESGGPNLLGAFQNTPPNTVDPLGQDIVVSCPQAYFGSLGLEEGRDYVNVGGNRWHSDIRAPLSFSPPLRKEIIREMLNSTRIFTAKKLDVEQLKLHVLARLNVVAATRDVKWTLGSDDLNPKFDQRFWSRAWVVKNGVKPSDAVAELFKAGADQRYTSGCRAGTLFAMLEGIRRTIPSSEFDKIGAAAGAMIEDQAKSAKLLDWSVGSLDDSGDPSTWVTGDRGYVGGNGPHGINAGQWLIYNGLGLFWGFGAATDRTSMSGTLKYWVNRDGADAGVRYWPAVGLEATH